MSADASIDVLMITHARPAYTRLALPRLLETCDETMRVWLWHNGRDDETLAVVRDHARHPRVHAFHHSETNVGLAEPTNWLWGESSGAFLSKIDDDCLMPDGWADTLRAAHASEPRFGALGCWRFQDEDFDGEHATRKIDAFGGGHRVLRNCWVEGSGYLMKRACVDALGLLRPGESFTRFCVRVAALGWINGWYYPFLRQEHMDDPRSPHSLLRTDDDLEKHLPLSARHRGTRTLDDWVCQLRRSAQIVQRAPVDPRLHAGVGRRVRRLWSRLKREELRY